MNERTFSSSREAHAFARELVANGKRGILLRRRPDGGFSVFSDQSPESPVPPWDGDELMRESLKDFRRPETQEDCDHFIEEIQKLLGDDNYPLIDPEGGAAASNLIRELAKKWPSYGIFLRSIKYATKTKLRVSRYG